MNVERLLRGLGDMDVEVRRDERLALHTTWRVGGTADFYCEPVGVESLAESIRLLRREDVRFFVLGGGSNLLFPDDGFRGVVVGTRRVRGVRFGDGSADLAAGEPLPDILCRAEEEGERGLGFLMGIPGTAGGAVAMNAGIPERTMGDAIETVRILDRAGQEVSLSRGDCAFGYRTSGIRENGWVVLSCRVSLGEEPFDREALLARRRATQPLDLPSAGCVFKNADGISAGLLIERSGLKGVTVGRARVSEKHANFIVNLGGATSAEICKLIDIVRQKVYNTFHVSLDLEVEVIDG